MFYNKMFNNTERLQGYILFVKNFKECCAFLKSYNAISCGFD